MCNQNNLTQSLRETARRGLIHFLYIYFLRFFLPLGLFFYYLFFIFSRNWFATHQRTFLLDFVAQITHTQHILSYPPRALHNDDDANKNTTPLFDKTSAASSTLANYTLNLFHVLTPSLSPQTFLLFSVVLLIFFSYFVFFFLFYYGSHFLIFFLCSFKFFNASYNFPSIFLVFFFNLSLRLSYLFFRAPYGMLLVCVLSHIHNLFRTFLPFRLKTFSFVFFFTFSLKSSKLQLSTTQHGFWKPTTLINLFSLSLNFPSLFFHLPNWLLSVVLAAWCCFQTGISIIFKFVCPVLQFFFGVLSY